MRREGARGPWYALSLAPSKRDPLDRQRAAASSREGDAPLRIGVEFRVASALERLGVRSALPVEMVRRRLSRRCRRRIEERRPMLPGVLFCEAPVCGWSRVLGLREVAGVFGRDGAPVRLSARDLDWVLARSERPMARPEVAPGDRVEVREGALAGWVVEVRSVRGGRLSVACGLFGGLEADVSLDAVRAA